jgi:hypothetical protein
VGFSRLVAEVRAERVPDSATLTGSTPPLGTPESSADLMSFRVRHRCPEPNRSTTTRHREMRLTPRAEFVGLTAAVAYADAPT